MWGNPRPRMSLTTVGCPAMHHTKYIYFTYLLPVSKRVNFQCIFVYILLNFEMLLKVALACICRAECHIFVVTVGAYKLQYIPHSHTFLHMLTLSGPSKCSAPYWSNPPFLFFDIRELWRSILSAREPKCQKI